MKAAARVFKMGYSAIGAEYPTPEEPISRLKIFLCCIDYVGLPCCAAQLHKLGVEE
jgi:hypothetical protein